MKHNQGLIRSHSSLLAALFRAMDIFLILGLLYLSALFLGVPWQDYFTVAGCIAIVIYIITAEITALYASWRLGSLFDENKQVIFTWLAVIFVLLIIAYATKTSSIYSRRVLLSWMVVTPIVLSLFRIIARQVLRELRQRDRNLRTAAIVGAGSQAMHLVEQIEKQPWSGIKLTGFYDKELPTGHQPENTTLSVLGDSIELINKAKNNEIDIIFIALPIIREEEIKKIIVSLSDTTVITYIVPDLFISELLNTRWGYMGNIPILSIHDRPFTGIDGWVKRLEDIILGSLILMLIAIPMIIIAIAVKLTSKGPAIFKQRRYGIAGEEISVWKFRTMTVCEDGGEIIQAKENDVRVTTLGKYLRQYSLDELPQFINVLQGTMSIVGPRPHAVAHNELYRKEIDGYMLRHSIKPGITGWAQINGWRGETDTLDKMEGRVDHDLWYIRNWSLWLDIKTIFLTVLHGFVGKQAY
jgi:putative colanic acid biosynthesis UDP-glucose lipid carrier transferase